MPWRHRPSPLAESVNLRVRVVADHRLARGGNAANRPTPTGIRRSSCSAAGPPPPVLPPKTRRWRPGAGSGFGRGTADAWGRKRKDPPSPATRAAPAPRADVPPAVARPCAADAPLSAREQSPAGDPSANRIPVHNQAPIAWSSSMAPRNLPRSQDEHSPFVWQPHLPRSALRDQPFQQGRRVALSAPRLAVQRIRPPDASAECVPDH